MAENHRPAPSRMPTSTCILILCAAVASTGTLLAYRHLSSAVQQPADGSAATQQGSTLLRFVSSPAQTTQLPAQAEVGAISQLQQQQQQRQQQQQQSEEGRDSSEDVHIVFSTSCSPGQDWQSFVLMYSVGQSGHKGPVTRIASGCTAEEERLLKHAYAKAFPSYHVHFTPDFSVDQTTGKKYHFYNKPFGVKHWLAFAARPITEPLVALLDPDMILMRPLTADLTADPNLVMHIKSTPARKIDRGTPAGQEYGLGGQWTVKEHLFNRPNICGANSPCLSTTEREATDYFAVGPPYIAHVEDMRTIAEKWAEFVPRVFEDYPHLLAEMYAYSMAAAHVELPHVTVDNYMVSDIRYGTNGEGWPDIHRLREVCPAALDSFVGQGPFGPKRYDFTGEWIPPVLHYCQFYRLGMEGFNKRLVPNDLFSCGSSKFMFEPDSSITPLRHKVMGGGKNEPMTERDAIRSAYMLCTIPRYINDALTYYRHSMCGARGQVPAREQKTVRADHPR